MLDASVKRAETKAHTLEAEAQERIKGNNYWDNKFRRFATLSLTLILLTVIGGIVYEGYLAFQSKAHIDCIVKLLATPPPPGTHVRILTNPSTTCNIRFTQ